jgi:hypothetical protein
MSNDVNLTLGICDSFVIRISSLVIHIVSHLIDKRPPRCHLPQRVSEPVQSYGTSGLHQSRLGGYYRSQAPERAAAGFANVTK